MNITRYFRRAHSKAGKSNGQRDPVLPAPQAISLMLAVKGAFGI